MNRTTWIVLLMTALTTTCLTAQTLPFNTNHYGHISTYITNPDNVVAIFDNRRTVLHPDIASFHQISRHSPALAADKNGVYYKGIFIETAPENVSVIGYTWDTSQTWLWKNNAHVFYGDNIIEGADPQTFTTFGSFNGDYFRDRAAIYYRDKRLTEADPASFRVGITTAYDNNHVYKAGQLLVRDGEPVQAVNHILYKTRQTVYQANRSIGSMDGVPVAGIDPATLRRLTNRLSIDKNHVYCAERSVPIAQTDFERLRYWEGRNLMYLSDGKTVYLCTSPLPWLDAKTFGMVPDTDLIFDKNGIYPGGYRDTPLRLPFRYTDQPTVNNIAVGKNYRYLIYTDQVFDLSEKQLYTQLDADTLTRLRNENVVLSKQTDGQFSAVLKEDNPNPAYYGFSVRNGVLTYQARPIENGQIDLASFQLIQPPFYQDKHAVYMQTGDQLQRIPGWSPKHLRVYEHLFITDGARLFYKQNEIKGVRGKGLELTAIFPGYRPIRNVPPGMHVDPAPQNIYYLFKTSAGYWLVDTMNEDKPVLTLVKGLKL